MNNIAYFPKVPQNIHIQICQSPTPYPKIKCWVMLPFGTLLRIMPPPKKRKKNMSLDSPLAGIATVGLCFIFGWDSDAISTRHQACQEWSWGLEALFCWCPNRMEARVLMDCWVDDVCYDSTVFHRNGMSKHVKTALRNNVRNYTNLSWLAWFLSINSGGNN